MLLEIDPGVAKFDPRAYKEHAYVTGWELSFIWHIQVICNSIPSYSPVFGRALGTMKFFTTSATLALLCTSALAAPNPSKACAAKPQKQEEKASAGGDWEDSLAEFKEKFTSTWKVVGTPDQVVLANGTAAPGEPSSIGYYNFGINSEKDLICWVRVVSPCYQRRTNIASSISSSRAPLGHTSPPP